MKKRSRAQTKVAKHQPETPWGIEVKLTQEEFLILDYGGLGQVIVVKKMTGGKGYHRLDELGFQASVSNAKSFAKEQGLSEQESEKVIAWVRQVEAMRGRGKELSATASINRTSAMSKEDVIKVVKKARLKPSEWSAVMDVCLAKLKNEQERLEQLEDLLKRQKAPEIEDTGGRPSGARNLKPDTPIVRNAYAMSEAGMRVQEIARQLHRSEHTVYKYLRIANSAG